MPTEPATGAANELFRATLQLWETAFKTGAVIQEESARRFTGMLTTSRPLPSAQTRPPMLFTQAIDTVQKSMEEAMRVVNESTRRTLDLFEKGLEAGRAKGAREGRAKGAREGQAKACEIWEATLGVIRADTQAVVEANARVLQSWAELGKRLGETKASGSV